MKTEEKTKIYDFWHDREARVKDLTFWPVKIVVAAERHIGELFIALAIEEEKNKRLSAEIERMKATP